MLTGADQELRQILELEIDSKDPLKRSMREFQFPKCLMLGEVKRQNYSGLFAF